MSDNHKQDMAEIKKLLWEFREGPAVVGVKRDVTVKLLESCIANMEDLNVIEEYAKELGWHPDMNTTAAIWVKDRAKKAGDEIADLAHPEFGEMGRLQEEIHNLKKDSTKLRDWASKIIGDGGPDLDAYLDGHVELPTVELKKEVEWLRYYKRNVYSCLGPADDDINMDITKSFVREKGIDALPNKERIRHLEYLDEHKSG